jgi:signal transduction histidine kinase
VNATKSEPSFNLLRRFGVASLAVIAAIAIVNGVLLSTFLTKRMLGHDAHVTKDFVQNVLEADGSIGYLTDPGNAQFAARFAGSILHFTSMADVQRINVYSRNRTVLWSTDPALIGQRFDANDELEEALHGELAFESGNITAHQRSKPEHIGFSPDSDFFVETYIPIRLPGNSEVLGVVETYKAPVALTAAIRDGRRYIWLTACLGALVLYLTLYWVVRSAHRKIEEQHHRLIKAETMAAVGELASSVAHNIRNPLASIRSSAELALDMTNSPWAEQASDIVNSVDRIEGWIRDLVSFAYVDSVSRVRVDANELIRECFSGATREFQRCGISGNVEAEVTAAHVDADRALLGHVLHSLVANAIEATPRGGRVTGNVTSVDGKVQIRIVDTGRGIAPEHLDKLFNLFFTTKPRGLGIGLTLVQRTIERIGGTISVKSAPGSGTVFVIELPAA